MVEGYTDVISMHQAGIENVVASSGTSLTVNQIRQVKRFTENLTIIYDGDAAGIKASMRGIDLVLEEGLNVKVVSLPEGEDPDSFAKSQSASQFIAHIEQNEIDFISFKTKLLLQETKKDPVQKARFISDIVKSISVIPDSITRSMYVKECADLMKMNEEILYTEINKKRNPKENQQVQQRRQPQPTPTVQPQQQKAGGAHTCEQLSRDLIKLLMNHGNTSFKLEEEYISVTEYIITEIEDDWENLKFANEMYCKVFKMFSENFHKDIFLDYKFFLNNPDSEISKLATDLTSSQHTLSNIWTKGNSSNEIKETIPEENVPKTVLEYKYRKVSIMIKQTYEKLKNLTPEDDSMELMKRFMNLKQVGMLLSKELKHTAINPLF